MHTRTTAYLVHALITSWSFVFLKLNMNTNQVWKGNLLNQYGLWTNGWHKPPTVRIYKLCGTLRVFSYTSNRCKWKYLRRIFSVRCKYGVNLFFFFIPKSHTKLIITWIQNKPLILSITSIKRRKDALSMQYLLLAATSHLKSVCRCWSELRSQQTQASVSVCLKHRPFWSSSGGSSTPNGKSGQRPSQM